MPAPTYAQRLTAGLQAMGWKIDPTDRSKYTAFVPIVEPVGPLIKFFVGPSGALRHGTCASKSVSVGQPSRITPLYRVVLVEGDTALGVYHAQ